MLIVRNEYVDNVSKIIEERYGIKLPYVYAAFLDRYNGGVTYDTENEYESVSELFGMTSIKKRFSFDTIEDMGLMEIFMNRGLFPIGDNDFGDIYCICVDEENKNYGAVYITYHELGFRRKKLFDSFREFIEESKSEPLGHIDTMEEREAMLIANGNGHLLEKLKPIWKEEIKYFSSVVQEDVILEEDSM